MDSDGGNVHRISFGGAGYSEPVWSPRGDLIAFTKKQGDHFYIGVMSPDGSGERLVADGFLVESPAWTPNGRVLLYAKESRTGKGLNTRLRSIDLTGRNEQAIKTAREASCGYWSNLLSVAGK
jgi:TolB protein